MDLKDVDESRKGDTLNNDKGETVMLREVERGRLRVGQQGNE